jgi:rubrerythrin
MGFAATAEVFLGELDRANIAALATIGAAASREPSDGVTVAKLLMLALKNEIEATECAAAWIPTTREVEVKLAFARQAGDEAKHYRLIEARLGELGIDASAFDPGPQSPMLAYLGSLTTTVERVAAGQFTREALAVVRNEEFIRFCMSRGDEATATLYRDVIQPDERHHHELGRRLLGKLAITEPAQDAARKAARRTLALAEELQEIARMKLGVSRAPGC